MTDRPGTTPAMTSDRTTPDPSPGSQDATGRRPTDLGRAGARAPATVLPLRQASAARTRPAEAGEVPDQDRRTSDDETSRGGGPPGLRIAVITTPAGDATPSSPLTGPGMDGLAPALERRGHELWHFQVPVTPDLRETLDQAAALGRRLAARFAQATRAPDVVLCDGVVSGVAAHAAAVDRCPVVIWTGSADLPDVPGLRRLAVAVLRSATRVCTTSRHLAEHLETTRLARRVGIIPPCVDTEVFHDVGWQDRSTETEARRPVVAVATARAPGGATDAGPGVPPSRGEVTDPVLRLLSLPLGSGRNGPLPIDVRVLPDADPTSLATALREADVVVSGPGEDGGRATLSAMASGVAVVALDRLPDREIVVDGTSGLLVSRIEEVAAAVDRLVRDPFAREALGQGGLDRVHGAHRPDAVASRLEAVLTTACTDAT